MTISGASLVRAAAGARAGGGRSRPGFDNIAAQYRIMATGPAQPGLSLPLIRNTLSGKTP